MGGSSNKILIVLLVIVAFTAAIVYGLTGNKNTENGSGTNGGSSFQAVELNSGQTIDFPEAYAGKKVALVFFSVGWPSCVDEVLQLQPKLAEWKNDSFQLVLVTSDSQEEIKGFIQKNNVDATVLMDTQGAIGNQFGVQYIPTDYLINADGTTEDNFVGWDSTRMTQMEQWIKGQ